MSASASERPDPHVAAAIARAERRRGVLEQLTETGMRIISEIEGRTVQAPLHPEPRHDPARAFAAVSRSVRLTLILEARIGRDILAMRKGRFLSSAAPSAADSVAQPRSNPARAKVRDAVWAAIDRESGDVETADVARRHLHERLIEGEAYDVLLSGPWRACVAAICADLGLSPDWSTWSDDAGFPPPARVEPVDAESG